MLPADPPSSHETIAQAFQKRGTFYFTAAISCHTLVFQFKQLQTIDDCRQTIYPKQMYHPGLTKLALLAFDCRQPEFLELKPKSASWTLAPTLVGCARPWPYVRWHIPAFLRLGSATGRPGGGLLGAESFVMARPGRAEPPRRCSGAARLVAFMTVTAETGSKHDHGLGQNHDPNKIMKDYLQTYLPENSTLGLHLEGPWLVLVPHAPARPRGRLVEPMPTSSSRSRIFPAVEPHRFQLGYSSPTAGEQRPLG